MRQMRRFFQNRYGIDQLSLALLLFAAAISLLLSLMGTPLATLVYTAALAVSLVRAFSRNIPARVAENQRWLAWARRLKSRFALRRRMIAEWRVSRFLRCPACDQMLRVPRGKGRIEVHCCRCHHRFIKKV